MPAKQLLILAICSLPFYCFSQDSSALSRILNFPGRFISKIDAKTSSLDKDLTRQTEKYLRKLISKEARLKKKLARIDSNATKELFSGEAEERYTALLKKLQTDSGSTAGELSGEYLPNIDSLKTMMSFLEKNPQLIASSKLLPADLSKSFAGLKQLQSKLQNAEEITQFMQQRKEQIRRYLTTNTQLPKNITGLYKDYSKQLFYYKQQVMEYKAMLNDPDKMVKKALELLHKVPAFTNFMKQHSMLAGLFNIGPANFSSSSYGGGVQSVSGFQSRQQMITLVQQQTGQNLPATNASMQGSLQSGQQYIDDLRNQLNSKSSELDIPNFKPNMQKTKRFLDRLEYGSNLQTQSANNFFPITTDLGLSVGYKLNDKNVIGIGVSYKVGWGKDFRNINVSSQGAGLRSFLDINIRKSFFLSGGFEYNYQQPFQSLNIVDDLDKWQQSGLLGMSKIVSIKHKTLKKTKIQLLWDFLSYRQIPPTPAVKFRIGYSF